MIEKFISCSWKTIILCIVSWWLGYLCTNCHFWSEGNCTGFLGKTLWDVLELLIIPVTLLGITAYLNRLEKKSDRELLLNNQRENSLQNYFEAVSKLIIDNNLLKKDIEIDVQKYIQARTISTIKILDPNRKSVLIRFLADLSLLTSVDKKPPIISLMGTDLNEIGLGVANLFGADLSGANLNKAYLACADLNHANLTGASISDAYLIETNFENAKLVMSNFTNSNMEKANLKNCDLWKANLRDTNLKGANFEGAKLKEVTLIKANLIGAIMPDGSTYDPKVHNQEWMEKMQIKYRDN